MDSALSLLACGIVLSEGIEQNSTDCYLSNQGSVGTRFLESNGKNTGTGKNKKKKKKKSICCDESDEGFIVFSLGKNGEVLQNHNRDFDEKDHKPNASDHRTPGYDDDDDNDNCRIHELSPDNEVEWASSRRRIMSLESSCPNLSVARTSSFAFPVLGWEWMGSPARMPRPECTELRRKRNKLRLFRFHCCIF